jgi:PPOX class probable F420-dependent enzyme
MPGYGVLPAGEGTGLLAWSWAEERLARSHDYWLATVWPDGRPHVMPVWGVWLDGALWFSCAPGSRKRRNLEDDPRCVLTTDDALEPVVVEGVAALVTNRDAMVAFTDAISAKYDQEYSVDFTAANALLRVPPVTAFALIEADFEGSPTRWRFQGLDEMRG